MKIQTLAQLIEALNADHMEQILDYGDKAQATGVRHLQCAEMGAWLERKGLNDQDGECMSLAIESLMAGDLDEMIYAGH